MEQELLDKNKELIDFAHRVSHDLRNPLNIIRAYVMAIKDEPELMNQYYERIVLQVDKSLTFINKLLELSKAGKTIGEKLPIKLEPMIREIFRSLNKNGDIGELIIESPVPDIPGDPVSIEQLFSNLMDNSFKYRNPGNEKLTIEISHRIRQDNVEIKIRDNGSGIDPEKIDKIFSPGYVIDRTKGTGFGLPIARKIADAHGGYISAESNGNGEGTVFLVSLPVKQ